MPHLHVYNTTPYWLDNKKETKDSLIHHNSAPIYISQQ